MWGVRGVAGGVETGITKKCVCMPENNGKDTNTHSHTLTNTHIHTPTNTLTHTHSHSFYLIFIIFLCQQLSREGASGLCVFLVIG
jgi:hypothetical protein